MSKRENGDRFNVVLETVPAQVTTSEPNIAYSIAEFMLNLLPITNPLPRSDVAAYVEKHFARSGGRFLFSCDQDFLQIYRK
jgi:hypothetical protein